MRRSILIATSLAVFVWFGGSPAFAQGGHPGGGHPGGPPSMAGGAGMGSHGASGSHDTMGNGKSESVSTMEGNKAPGTLLTQNKKLASKLSALLAKQNITLQQAAPSDFRNLGQFVAAVHVSNNLDIPFMQLKTAMLAKGGSLGKAITTLRPDADSKAETKTAQKQTDEDVRESQTDTDANPGS